MKWLVLGCLFSVLVSCSGNHDQNDPYVIEETELNYEAPAPYYDETDQDEIRREAEAP